MCGRFVQKTPLSSLQDTFGFASEDLNYIPNYNVAPGRQALAVLAGEPRRGLMLRWGLVPVWAKDDGHGYKMINARAETIAEKPAFKGLIKSKRCIIPADGFYEWQKDAPGGKLPFLFESAGSGGLALAGLWEAWQDRKGNKLLTFTIITTRANDLVGRIHDRMPVILTDEAASAWLDRDPPETERLAELLSPYPERNMTSRPVSRRVNLVANDGPEVLKPDPEQTSLF